MDDDLLSELMDFHIDISEIELNLEIALILNKI